MTTLRIEDVNLADSTFRRLTAGPGSLQLEIQDWRKITLLLSFFDVIGFQALSLGTGDLSHGYEDSADGGSRLSFRINEALIDLPRAS